jgi:hypothetical protein
MLGIGKVRKSSTTFDQRRRCCCCCCCCCCCFTKKSILSTTKTTLQNRRGSSLSLSLFLIYMVGSIDLNRSDEQCQEVYKNSYWIGSDWIGSFVSRHTTTTTTDVVDGAPVTHDTVREYISAPLTHQRKPQSRVDVCVGDGFCPIL